MFQVYANSVFGEGARFVSVANLVEETAAEHPEDATQLRDLMHIVFGVSKVSPTRAAHVIKRFHLLLGFLLLPFPNGVKSTPHPLQIGIGHTKLHNMSVNI